MTKPKLRKLPPVLKPKAIAQSYVGYKELSLKDIENITSSTTKNMWMFINNDVPDIGPFAAIDFTKRITSSLDDWLVYDTSYDFYLDVCKEVADAYQNGVAKAISQAGLIWLQILAPTFEKYNAYNPEDIVGMIKGAIDVAEQNFKNSLAN